MPTGAEADVKEGDALALPFADGEFDRVVAAEVLEHIPADIQAIGELVRVLRPGGTMAVSVPRWFPEVVYWKLSDDYHNIPGGHIRIYTDKELVAKVENAGLVLRGQRTTPTACTRRTGGSSARSGCTTTTTRSPKAYHRLLVWDIMKQPPDAAAGRARAGPGHRQEHGALLPQARCRLTRRPGALGAGVLTPPRWPRPPPRSPRAGAGRRDPVDAPASTPTSGTTSRRPWRCSSAGEVEAAERAYAWVPGHAARGRLLADEGGRRRGRGRTAARPTWRPTSRSGCGTTGWSAATSGSSAGTGRRCAAPWTGWSRCSCRSAASPGRRSGPTAGPVGSTRRRCWPGSSSIYHGAAGRGRARRAARRAAARVGARRRPARPRAARAPRPVPRQVRVLDGLVLPGARRRRPRRRRRAPCWPPRWDDVRGPGLGIRCVSRNPG